jgi:hypothetical protein
LKNKRDKVDHQPGLGARPCTSTGSAPAQSETSPVAANDQPGLTSHRAKRYVGPPRYWHQRVLPWIKSINGCSMVSETTHRTTVADEEEPTPLDREHAISLIGRHTKQLAGLARDQGCTTQCRALISRTLFLDKPVIPFTRESPRLSWCERHPLTLPLGTNVRDTALDLRKPLAVLRACDGDPRVGVEPGLPANAVEPLVVRLDIRRNALAGGEPAALARGPFGRYTRLV